MVLGEADLSLLVLETMLHQRYLLAVVVTCTLAVFFYTWGVRNKGWTRYILCRVRSPPRYCACYCRVDGCIIQRVVGRVLVARLVGDVARHPRFRRDASTKGAKAPAKAPTRAHRQTVGVVSAAASCLGELSPGGSLFADVRAGYTTLTILPQLVRAGRWEVESSACRQLQLGR